MFGSALYWMKLCLFLLGPLLAGAWVCPPLLDVNAAAQRIVVPCGKVRAKGLCDEAMQCRALVAPNDTASLCASKLPCNFAGEACRCSDAFVCHRRVSSQKTVVLLCLAEHAKRQEAHSAGDDDDESGTSRDGTLVFLGILGLTYTVLACLGLIYMGPHP